MDLQELDEFLGTATAQALQARVRSGLKKIAQDMVDTSLAVIAGGDAQAIAADKDNRIWAGLYLRDIQNQHDANRAFNVLVADNANLTEAQFGTVTDNQLENRLTAIVPFLVQLRADR